MSYRIGFGGESSPLSVGYMMGKGSVTPIGSLLKTIKKSLKRGQIFILILGQKAIRCSASGGFAPLTRGSAPGPRWGLRPQTPVIGSRYRARHPAPPLLNSWIRPWILTSGRKYGTAALYMLLDLL